MQLHWKWILTSSINATTCFLLSRFLYVPTYFSDDPITSFNFGAGWILLPFSVPLVLFTLPFERLLMADSVSSNFQMGPFSFINCDTFSSRSIFCSPKFTNGCNNESFFTLCAFLPNQSNSLIFTFPSAPLRCTTGFPF